MKLTLPTNNRALTNNIRCTNCNAILPSHANFCGVCGAANNTRCTSCNAVLPSHANFCGVCGARLNKSVKAWSIASILSDTAFILLPLCAFVLWFLSLSSVNVQHMTDLGLVSVLPALSIVALIILVV